jgi:alkanesulfonate monooxygenase SsuD/methylene tetrahydromethanopterin reductase-like flavin-dependent oxidoreductase (luciferase family)
LKEVKFGAQLPQETDNFDLAIEAARECESLGYDSIWAFDHLSPFWTSSKQNFECWTLLSAVAQHTKQIKIGTLVTNVNLRNPALLAKMSSTLDVISNGRLILGLGTGDRLSREELVSYGYTFSPLEERVERLRETIMILKAMWTQPEASFAGRYYQISNAINMPKPKQKPHPPIWVAGRHRKVLDVVAELADGWNYWRLNKNQLRDRSRYVSHKSAEFGRGGNSITKSWTMGISDLSFAGNKRALEKQDIIENLKAQVDDETRYFIASFGPHPEPKSYRLFAEAVRTLG